MDRAACGEQQEKPDFGYPYQADDGRENQDASDAVLRTLRGGSWDGSDRFVRCACRHGNIPHLRHNNVGFRVVSLDF